VLKYLEHYEEKDNEVIFRLKDLPSVKTAGKKYVRELYIHLFNDQTLQLNRVQKIDDVTYRVEKVQGVHCLNCKAPIFFSEEDDKTTCESCSWVNLLDADPPADIAPIVIKADHALEQIAYPPLEKSDLTHLPEKLREYVEIYFKEPEKFSKEMYQHLYHSFYRKDIEKFNDIRVKYQQKMKLARFFKDTNLFK